MPVPDERAAGQAAGGRHLRHARQSARPAPDVEARQVPGLRRAATARDGHHGHVRRQLVVLRALHARPHADDAGRPRRPPPTGCPSTSTSAASSTPFCTCSIRASSRARWCDTGHLKLTSKEPFARAVHAGHGRARDLPVAQRAVAAAEPRCASRARATRRKAFEIATGAPVEIGSIEKMSKSRKNTVDLDDFINQLRRRYRALVRAVRQPARARRHLHRRRRRRARAASCSASGAWSSECADRAPPRAAPEAGSSSARRPRPCAAPPTRRSTQVGPNIEGLRFNVAVAQVYEFANALQVGPGARLGRAWIGRCARPPSFWCR